MTSSKKKFNPKVFQGRQRVYTKVAGCTNIQRVWIWDSAKGEYTTRERGNVFEAMRYEFTKDGGKKRVRGSFATLELARNWQNRVEPLPSSFPVLGADGVRVVPTQNNPANADFGPLLGDVYREYHRRKISRLAEGTRLKYEQYVRLHLQEMMSVPIRKITPAYIDRWLDDARKKAARSKNASQRCSFEHELIFLNGLINYYIEYHEDPAFKSPLRKRHRQDAVLCKPAPKHRDFTEEEFWLFEKAIRQGEKLGHVLAPMATVQFFQALRISEVAAIHFEDINLNRKEPQESTLRICRHLIYLRQRGRAPMLADGFKNAGGGVNSVKEQPVFQQTYEAIKDVFRIGTGLIFANPDGSPLTYRQIQKAYDLAFKRAKLPYRGTHVLRHGGCRRVYNATKDLALAQMLLGNTDMDSTLVYAKRDKGAFKDYAKLTWKPAAGNC